MTMDVVPPAIACAQRALAVLIDKRIMLLGIVETLHQIFVRSTAPIAIDRINELLPVAGRAVEVDHDDDISVGRKQLRIPAKRPIVPPRPLRPAMDEEFHG